MNRPKPSEFPKLFSTAFIDPAAKQCELLRPLRRSRAGGNLLSFVAYQRTPLGPRLRGDDVEKIYGI
jgi:hypothetical protein